MSISIRELARVALPREWNPKVLALLSGYFDETFRPNLTVIAGFVGTDVQWAAVERQWRAVLDRFGVTSFHGSSLWSQRDQFSGWPVSQCEQFGQQCADVLVSARLGAIKAIFHGDWADVLAQAPPLASQFPDAYSFVFAMAASQIQRTTKRWHEGSSGVACVFEAHNKYGPNALAVWTARQAELPIIASVNYAISSRFPVLECADMLANESGRSIRGGDTNTLPLLNALAAHNYGFRFAGSKQTTQTLLSTFQRDPELTWILSPPETNEPPPTPEEHDALVDKYRRLDR